MSPEASSSPADARAARGGAATLDRLSERLLARAPWRVAVAATEAQREAVYALRHEQVTTAGWAAGAVLDGGGARPGHERDAHDDHALHVAAFDGAALVGAIRLVLPRPGRRLPAEEAFDLDIEPRGRVVDVGRLVITPRYRGDPEHLAWGALFARSWLEIRRRGFGVMAGAASARLVALYRRQGLAFEILGPAREHWGEQRHPVRLDPDGAAPARWFGQTADA